MSHEGARQKLAAARAAAGLSQKTLGTLCGVAGPVICEWERGTRTPRYTAALALEAVLVGAPTVEEWGFDRAAGVEQRRRTA